MSSPNISTEMEIYKENLIKENEKDLKEVFINQTGIDEVPNFKEEYDKWVGSLTVMDLESILE